MSRSFKKNPVRKWSCERRLRNRMLRAKLQDANLQDAFIDGGFTRKMLDAETETRGWESWNQVAQYNWVFGHSVRDEPEEEIYKKWLKKVMGK